MRKLLVLITRS